MRASGAAPAAGERGAVAVAGSRFSGVNDSGGNGSAVSTLPPRWPAATPNDAADDCSGEDPAAVAGVVVGPSMN